MRGIYLPPAARRAVLGVVATCACVAGLSVCGSAVAAAETGHPPVITAFEPKSGQSSGGTPVRVVGENLAEATEVWFNETAVPATCSETECTLLSPAGDPGVSVGVSVHTAAGWGSSSQGFYFIPPPPPPPPPNPNAPVITAFEPTSGQSSGGTPVRIVGEHLAEATEVWFGDTGVPATCSETECTLLSPPGRGGTYVGVGVRTADGQAWSSLTFGFTPPPPPPPPEITEVEPIAGKAAGGTPVTIRGERFEDATEVWFGETAVPATCSETECTTTSPAGLSGLTVSLGIRTVAGNALSSFAFMGPGAAPTVKGVGPKKGPVTGGNRVTIKGSNFRYLGAAFVYFGAKRAKIESQTEKAMTVEVPPGAEGTVQVTVETPDGTSGPGAKTSYTYKAVKTKK